MGKKIKENALRFLANGMLNAYGTYMISKKIMYKIKGEEIPRNEEFDMHWKYQQLSEMVRHTDHFV